MGLTLINNRQDQSWKRPVFLVFFILVIILLFSILAKREISAAAGVCCVKTHMSSDYSIADKGDIIKIQVGLVNEDSVQTEEISIKVELDPEVTYQAASTKVDSTKVEDVNQDFPLKAFYSIGKLQKNGEKGASKVLTFQFKVKETLPAGTAKLLTKLYVKCQDGTYNPLTLHTEVASHQLEPIEISFKETDNGLIGTNPGSSGNLQIKINNQGEEKIDCLHLIIEEVPEVELSSPPVFTSATCSNQNTNCFIRNNQAF